MESPKRATLAQVRMLAAVAFGYDIAQTTTLKSSVLFKASKDRLGGDYDSAFDYVSRQSTTDLFIAQGVGPVIDQWNDRAVMA